MSNYRVTVDTGGTFSDFVFFSEDTGEITITKVPSTPKEPFQAVLNGVKELMGQGVPAGNISFVGLPGSDGRILALAHAYEQRSRRFVAPPTT